MKNDIKNNQRIAFIILIPMLIFSFFITIKSEGIEKIEESEALIHEYFYYKNKKDLYSTSKLLKNSKDISNLKSQLQHLDKISLINIKEETNESIIKAYLNNNSVKLKELKVYKVKYKVSYNKNTSDEKYINGINEAWFFVTKENDNQGWVIDICEL